MREAQIAQYLQSVETPPDSASEFIDWMEGIDVVELLSNDSFSYLPICFVRKDIFLYGLLVPENLLDTMQVDDLMAWNFPISRGWSYVVHERDSELTSVVWPPGELSVSSILEEAEPMVYLRHFVRRVPEEEYVEVNQKLTHLGELHWIDDRQSFCRLDEEANVIDAIALHQEDPAKLVNIEALTLKKLLVVEQKALFLLFDIHRCADWSHWSSRRGISKGPTVRTTEDGLIFDKTQNHDVRGLVATSIRGVRIIRGPTDRRTRTTLLLGRPDDDPSDQSFIFRDRQWNLTREYPLATGEFDHLPPPNVINPAFFRPEVLDRYKADPDKYLLGQASIECRGVWYLRSYDLNDAGQVYVYLKDLWSLPTSEQKYWQAFNEEPKAEISERSISQDFNAVAWMGPDPLLELVDKLRHFPLATQDSKKCEVWSSGSKESLSLMRQLHYLHTSSNKEWRDQIQILHKVIIEGMHTKAIRRLAQALECDN